MTTARATALYVGALLGPSLLLLPGLAAGVAGPASVLAWAGLLVLSGLLAGVFTALGTRYPSAAGAAGYVRAAFGERAGTAVAWCFLGGVVCGAPVVCLVGGNYAAALLGAGRTTGVVMAAALLLVVIGTTLRGARAGGALQLMLVGVLVGLVAVAVVGSAPQARASNWTPFAPHGWGALGPAASLLMMSFVGWEAIAPLTARLRDPAAQLPRITASALAVTSVIYLALATTSIAVLGTGAATSTPLSALLEVAVGRPGPAIAAAAAVALTVAASNAYITGATEMLTDLTTPHPRTDPPVSSASYAPNPRLTRLSTPFRGGFRAHDPRVGLQVAIAAAGVMVLTAVGAGVVGVDQLVALPTTLFLAVYLVTTAAAARLLTGRTKVVAVVACGVVAGVTAFSGWALVVPGLIFLVVQCPAPASSALRAMSASAARWAAASR